jgi:SAM-dependent methyltransferase
LEALLIDGNRCHICKAILVEMGKFQSFFQVTSDCRPWKAGGRVAICSNCGTIQKPITNNLKRDVEKIYSCYEMYMQGGGAEQVTFEPSKGTGMSRSQKILSWIQEVADIDERGTMLDIGCGNGAFLKAFGSKYQGWKMSGLELDDRNRNNVESIIGVEKLHVGNIESIAGRFALISLIHSLEHIPNVVDSLKIVSSRLEQNGIMLIQVPNVEVSPFELLIADHFTHFTIDSLKVVLVNAGFEIEAFISDFVPKEISLLAKKRTKKLSNADQPALTPLSNRSFINAKNIVSSHITWLQRIIQQGRDTEGRVGIFGTSNSATWLASTLGDKVAFFVDEDPSRTGGMHLEKSIYAPVNAPKDSVILMPLRMDIAQYVVNRHTAFGLNYLLPPIG